jgi:hypothetical protein
MTDIETVCKTAAEFLQHILGTDEVHIVGATKKEDAWEVEAEVFEESAFMKSLGLPTRTQDKNLYQVKLNAALEVESYERQDIAAHTS